jgi:hypothetical protein
VHPPAGTIQSDVGNTITVSGTPSTIHFTVRLDDGSQPRAVWSVDDVRIGSVGDDGVFHANGYVGGVVTVTATVGSGTLSTKITVNVDIVDSSPAVPDADKAPLAAGGQGGDAQFKWLYPYDRTVFPRGLAAPSLQLAATGARSTYLEISAAFFRYRQFAMATSPLRVIIRDPVWKGLTLTVGATDAVTVAVTKLDGNVVSGPLKESWFVAPGSLKGTIYYNTYKSPLAPNGGVMRIQAGQTAEVLMAGCTVCHSVSANGSVLAGGSNNAPDEIGDWNPVDSATYDLSAAGSATQRTRSAEGRLFSS